MRLADLARLALERVAEDQRRDAGGARDAPPRPRGSRCGEAMMIDAAAREPRIAGLRRLVARRREVPRRPPAGGSMP